MMRGNFHIPSAFVLRTMMEGMSCNAGSDCISHDPDRRAVHLLQRGRSGRCAGASPVARPSLVLADVRAAIRPTGGSLSPGRARLSGLRTQRLAGPETVRVHV